MKNVTAIVLAGGQGKRLGQAKAMLKLGGEVLIEGVIEKVTTLADEVIVVTSNSQNNLPHDLEAEVFTDIYPGKSALGGVYTGLVKSGNTYNLVVACDMPFLNLGLLEYMTSLASGVDMVTIKVGHNAEPLHGIYSKQCIGPIQNMIEKNDLQINHLLEAVKVRYIDEDELDKYDPHHLSFFNINNRTDFARAKKLKEAMAK